jgi:hypothetical protein
MLDILAESLAVMRDDFSLSLSLSKILLLAEGVFDRD